MIWLCELSRKWPTKDPVSCGDESCISFLDEVRESLASTKLAWSGVPLWCPTFLA